MQGPKFQVPWAYVYRQRNARETKYKSAPLLSDSSDRSGGRSGATHSKKRECISYATTVSLLNCLASVGGPYPSNFGA